MPSDPVEVSEPPDVEPLVITSELVCVSELVSVPEPVCVSELDSVLVVGGAFDVVVPDEAGFDEIWPELVDTAEDVLTFEEVAVPDEDETLLLSPDDGAPLCSETVPLPDDTPDTASTDEVKSGFAIPFLSYHACGYRGWGL